MDSEGDGTISIPSLTCDLEESTNGIIVQITPSDENEQTASEIPSLTDYCTVKLDSLHKHNDSILFENMQSGPPSSDNSGCSNESFSINTKMIGLKTLQSPYFLKEQSKGSETVVEAASFITMGPPINAPLAFPAGSLSPNNTSIMSTLSAPMQVISSVHTANQPKSSRLPQTDGLSTASATGEFIQCLST